MNANVVRAVFKRNFISYFSSPTGYVFICVYVLLSSFAAFWPAEFFNANLANLEQLNRYVPYILLIFIPAITMGIWAEERRQGTDELLLTIPAADFDVVVGKYLAAVAIFSVALVFSMITNFLVLLTLGQPDLGLLLGTHVGYWMMGLAMLAVGMIASFLTSNLTVSYILGAVFNAPLAFLSSAELIVSDATWASIIKRWSFSEQFRDFSRGVISFSGIFYFILVAAAMLYIAMVLIGRRHWMGGKDGQSMLGHYIVRAIALLAVVVGANVILANHDVFRLDVTTERLSSLATRTKELIRNLDTPYTVKIDAYISPRVPEGYVETRLDLLSALREFQALGGEKVQVEIHHVENFSEEANRARERFSIEGRRVQSRARGALTEEEIYLAAAFTCGLEKEVVPFFSKGVPIEYELVRSIVTVAQGKKKRAGILKTDVPLQGGFDFQGGGAREKQMLITELEKQYDVVEVDPANEITEEYDVLVAVQPSSLNQEQMDHFIEVVLAGQPTVIFEDPLANFFPNVPGTAQPKQPPGGMNFMQQQPPEPKGRIERLWSRLGIEFTGSQVIWQNYNPFPKASQFIRREWVFVGPRPGVDDAFNKQHPVVSGLQQVLFLYPGSVRKLNSSTLEFTKLAVTGTETGTVPANQIFLPAMFGMGGGENPDLPILEMQGMTGNEYVLAAQIKGKPIDDGESALSGIDSQDDDENGEAKQEKDVNVIVVADIDCLHSVFFFVRERGMEEEDEVQWDLDNVTFALNTIDYIAGDDRFVEIRKRRPQHRELGTVVAATADARERADELAQQFNLEFEKKRQEAQDKFREDIKKIEENEKLPDDVKATQVMIAQQQGQRRLDIQIAGLQQERDRQRQQIESQLNQDIRAVQDQYKFWAVVLPPILPLLVAFFVYFNRRAREQEGVSKSRLR